MARPHIEFIMEQDYEYHHVQLPPFFNHLRGRNCIPPMKIKKLSEDYDTKGFSSLVYLPHGWDTKEPAAFNTAQELFIIKGQLTVYLEGKETVLTPGCYLRVAEGIRFGPVSTWHSCQLLWMVDRHPEIVAGYRTPRPIIPNQVSPDITLVDTNKQEWEIPFVKGPEPGLMLKLLWMDEHTGAYSRLIGAEKGWNEERQEHHDCMEEAYMLAGHMVMGGLGKMSQGGYFWRPPKIKHGPMHTTEGAVIFIRTDGPLHNYYTSVDGVPLNY